MKTYKKGFREISRIEKNKMIKIKKSVDGMHIGKQVGFVGFEQVGSTTQV